MMVVLGFDEFIARVLGLLKNKICVTVKEIYVYFYDGKRIPTHLKVKINENQCTNTLYSSTYLNALILYV